MNCLNKSYNYFLPKNIILKRTYTLPKRSFPMIEDKRAIPLLFKEQMNIQKLSLHLPLEVEEKKQLTQQIIELNPKSSLVELFCTKPWSIDAFNEPHLPTVVGQLENLEEFSKRSGDQYLLLMDMLIRHFGKGWKIPIELSQFAEVINKAAKFERLINPNYNNYDVYITIDQREVNPGESQRRTGWHADSFINTETRFDASDENINIETDSIYLVSDCIPTEFCAGPFPFNNIDPNDTEQVLKHFENIAKNKYVVTYPAGIILRLTSECIHQVGISKFKSIVPRTFCKITFKKTGQQLNREGNKINKLFDLNWPMFPRDSNKRNHSSIISLYHQNTDEHRLLSKQELNRLFYFPDLQHALKKAHPVSAYLATPGELLQTIQENFLTTVNIAKPGDWKITTMKGVQYFLSSEKMDLYYEKACTSTFTPKPKLICYVELKEPIRIMAPWKSMQYLRRGDYLVNRDNEFYGVLRADFEAHYFIYEKNPLYKE